MIGSANDNDEAAADAPVAPEEEARPAFGPLIAATLVAPDLDAAAGAYTTCFGYEVRARGSITMLLAEAWTLPRSGGASQIVLGPANGAAVEIRLIGGPEHPDYEPLRTYGWASIELTVADVDALALTLKDSPFTIIGQPPDLDFSDAIRAMQLRGPCQ